MAQRNTLMLPVELVDDREAREWLIEEDRGRKFLTSKLLTKGKGDALRLVAPPAADAWTLRDQFLQVNSQKDEEIIEFLNRAGSWHHDLRSPGTIEDFGDWQRIIRALMLTPPARWEALEKRFDPEKLCLVLEPHQPVEFGWNGKRLGAYVLVQGVLDAISLTVHYDHIRGAKFKSCARPDCGLPFTVESRHKRKYCTWYCGHIESVRKNRKLNNSGKVK
jgi:hypothetical protein